MDIIKNRFIIEFYKLLKKYFINKKNIYINIVFELISNNKLCLAVINFILLFIVFFSLFYIVLSIIQNSFNTSGSWFSNLFIKDPSLGSYPEYNQISNIIYISDWFSIDYGFIINFVFILSFLISIYFIHNLNNDYYTDIFFNFNYSIVLFIIILIIYVVIYLYNYSNIITLSKKVNDSMNLIYNNINYEFIDAYKICDYFENTKNNDNFENGKCNNALSKYKSNFIKNYIQTKISNITNINNMSADDFKKLEVYNKIKTALFTNSIIKYFIKNNQENELKEFFSIANITNTNYLDNIYKFHINPFLYLKMTDLSFLNTNYSYNEYINAFSNNNKIFFAIIKDYNDLEYNLSNNIVSIYNICRLKMLSSSFINHIMVLIIILFIVIYIIFNYNK
jgi:hypothetical protein